jgi:hypothetical protein
MDGALTPVVAWMAKVSHRKAPGAMSAMAFIVKPVKPKVGFISTGVVSAIHFSFSRLDCLIGGDRPASDVEVLRY